MNDEDECLQKPLVPDVQLTLGLDFKPKQLLVVPSTISPIVQEASKTVVGNISIRYSYSEHDQNHETTEEEFDEDEQLYSAVNTQAILRNYPSATIPVYLIEDSHTVAIIVPHFANTMTEKLVAAKIVSLADRDAQWLVLAPCQINNNLSICRLDLSPQWYSNVPLLQPPHFVTGFSASIISAIFKSGYDLSKVSVLVLNSEGQPGFEKIDADALMEAAENGAKFIVGNEKKDGFLKELSVSVRKINSSATSGMYI